MAAIWAKRTSSKPVDTGKWPGKTKRASYTITKDGLDYPVAIKSFESTQKLTNSEPGFKKHTQHVATRQVNPVSEREQAVLRFSRGKVKTGSVNRKGLSRRMAYCFKKSEHESYGQYLREETLRQIQKFAYRVAKKHKLNNEITKRIARGVTRTELDAILRDEAMVKRVSVNSPKRDSHAAALHTTMQDKMKRVAIRKQVELSKLHKENPKHTVMLQRCYQLNEDGDRKPEFETIRQAKEMISKVTDLLFALDKVHYHLIIEQQLADRRQKYQKLTVATGDRAEQLKAEISMLEKAIGGYNQTLNSVYLTGYRSKALQLIDPLTGDNQLYLKSILLDFIKGSPAMTEEKRKGQLAILRPAVVAAQKIMKEKAQQKVIRETSV